MNGSYYNTFTNNGMSNNTFTNPNQSNNQVPNQQILTPYQENSGINSNITDNESYIENILRLNKGKKVKIHVVIPGSVELQDRVFEGIIEQIGKDHVIVSNPNTGEWDLILIIYIVFVTFEEPLNYSQKFYN